MPAALEGKRPLRSAQWLHNPHQLDPLEPRLYFPVKELPISKVKLWLPWEPRGTLCSCWWGTTQGWCLQAPPSSPPMWSPETVWHPSILSCCPLQPEAFIHKATSASPASPPGDHSALPAEPQPRPLPPGHAEGSVPPSASPSSRLAPTHVEQASNSSDHITCVAGLGGGGAQRLGCGSAPFRFPGFSAQGSLFGNRGEEGQTHTPAKTVHLGKRLQKGGGQAACGGSAPNKRRLEKDGTGCSH